PSLTLPPLVGEGGVGGSSAPAPMPPAFPMSAMLSRSRAPPVTQGIDRSVLSTHLSADRQDMKPDVGLSKISIWQQLPLTTSISPPPRAPAPPPPRTPPR